MLYPSSRRQSEIKNDFVARRSVAPASEQYLLNACVFRANLSAETHGWRRIETNVGDFPRCDLQLFQLFLSATDGRSSRGRCGPSPDVGYLPCSAKLNEMEKSRYARVCSLCHAWRSAVDTESIAFASSSSSNSFRCLIIVVWLDYCRCFARNRLLVKSKNKLIENGIGESRAIPSTLFFHSSVAPITLISRSHVCKPVHIKYCYLKRVQDFVF